MSELKKDYKNKLEKIKRLYKIFNCNPQFLSTYIILYKTLGMNKDLAMDAMEVLYYRVNILKEKFDYNKYISENIKKIPTIPEIPKISNSDIMKDISYIVRSSTGKK